MGVCATRDAGPVAPYYPTRVSIMSLSDANVREEDRVSANSPNRDIEEGYCLVHVQYSDEQVVNAGNESQKANREQQGARKMQNPRAFFASPAPMPAAPRRMRMIA